MEQNFQLPTVTTEHLAELQAAPRRPRYRRELLPRDLCEQVVTELQRTAADAEAQDLLDRAHQHLRAHRALERQESHRRRRQLGASSATRQDRARRFGERLRRLEAEADENHTSTMEN